MNNRNKRTFASFLFMLVFSTKMIISVMPIFYLMDAKVAASVILQLEHETKSDKDNTSKDVLKEKKDFDEHTYASFDYAPTLMQTMHQHHFILSLAVQPYHGAVPTPPPNA